MCRVLKLKFYNLFTMNQLKPIDYFMKYFNNGFFENIVFYTVTRYYAIIVIVVCYD